MNTFVKMVTVAAMSFLVFLLRSCPEESDKWGP